MTALRMGLTDRAIEKLPFASEGQYIVRDAELKGFLLVVGKRRKTFTVKSEGWQDGKRKNIYGALGLVGELSARDARLKARECLTRIAKGLPVFGAVLVDPAAGEASADPDLRDVTLGEAWERYRDVHMVRRNRSARTIALYADHVHRILQGWKDRPLKEFGEEPALVAARHDEITAANGPYIANGALRTFRAVYNHARKTHRSLPADNPADAIDWNEEVRRDTGMGPKELPGWFDELVTLDNPLRREFHLFSVLSGCRPGALKVAEVEHVDLRRRVLHIPAPKGGAKKAFDIPLSRPMVLCLIRAIRLSRILHCEHADRWIFSADSLTGHIAEQKEDRSVLSKYANDLRQTFRTMAQCAEVPKLDVHILMNHALVGVNEGYITRSALLESHLRQQQQRVSGAILQAVGAGRGQRRARTLAWLRSAKVDALALDVLDELDLDASYATAVQEPGPETQPRRAHEIGSRPRAPTLDIRVTAWAGDVVGSTKLERDHGIPRTTLHGWQKQNRVIGLLTGTRKHVFPLAQFVDGRPVEGLAEILALAGSARAAWRWLVEPHPALDGHSPLSRLQVTEARAMISLAKRDFGRDPEVDHSALMHRAA